MSGQARRRQRSVTMERSAHAPEWQSMSQRRRDGARQRRSGGRFRVVTREIGAAL